MFSIVLHAVIKFAVLIYSSKISNKSDTIAFVTVNEAVMS